MTWVIIVVLMLAAFGPVLWLLPSAKDKRLARMRARARALGLFVEITSRRKRDAAPSERVSAGGKLKTATVTCTAYRRPFVRPNNRLPEWKLERSAQGPTSAAEVRRGEAGPLPGWVWEASPTGMEQAFFSRLEALVARLPADAVAFEATRLDVAVCWLETATADSAESTVESLNSVLQDCAEMLVSLNDRIEARFAGNGVRD